MPLVCGLFVFVRVCSMSSIARYSSYGCRPGRAAVLATPIGEYSNERNALVREKRQHAIIEEVRRRNRRLFGVQLGKRDFAVRVDERLLVDAADALEGADIEGVLRSTVAGTFAFEFAARFFFPLHAFERRH